MPVTSSATTNDSSANNYLKMPDGSYTLITGERRLQAARLAGLRTVPVVVRYASDQQFLELALIENVQRDGIFARDHQIQDLPVACSAS